jgi:Ca2+-transporting ATPase
VPADGVVVSAENLLLDESVVTGESLPIDKRPDNELLAGTLLVHGRAIARVLRTGPLSALGAVAGMLARVHPEPTPLERRLDRFGRRVAVGVVGIAVVLMAAGLIAGGWERSDEVFLLAVALAVAAVPEGLPAVLTLTLALGVERMARRRAVVRRLASVESLGSVTVIATDKTGTLTENRLGVRALDSPDPPGALRAMVLASDAEPGSDAGDPLEQALLHYAAAEGIDPAALRGDVPRLSSRSFESDARFMRVSVIEGEAVTSYLKGAPEILLARARLSPTERATWLARTEAAAADGFRTLGLARVAGEGETDLEWLGIASLWDPPRPEVQDAVRRALEAGIRLVMITGDHAATAATVARRVGMPFAPVASGADVEARSDAQLERLVRETAIFARMNPAHKLRVIAALQAAGEIVAVTGDGVNDAPALKRADVGIAMGRRGSDVAREVADLVITDDNFATIVAAVEEGRGIYANIQKFVRFLFSTNLSEVLVVALGALAAFAFDVRDAVGALLLPLTAAQLLWINLLTDGAPALALGLDHNPGVMRASPRHPAAPLLDRASVTYIIGTGSVIAAVVLGLLAWLVAALHVPAAVAASATFASLALTQVLCTYPARRSGEGPLKNRAIHAAVVISIVAQLLVLSVPAMMRWFNVVLLPPVVAAVVTAGVLMSWLGVELVARLVWRPVNAPGATPR